MELDRHLNVLRALAYRLGQLQQQRRGMECLLNGLRKRGRFLEIFMYQPVAQLAPGQPVQRVFENSQALSAVQVVQQRAGRFTQQQKQARNQLFAQVILQAAKTGRKGLDADGKAASGAS